MDERNRGEEGEFLSNLLIDILFSVEGHCFLALWMKCGLQKEEKITINDEISTSDFELILVKNSF